MTASATTTHPITSPSGPVMPAARQQTGAGAISWLGPTMAMILTGIGVVLLHDAIATADTRPGRTWSAALLDGLNRITAEWWMIPAGIAVALTGIWLIITALRPRSRKTLQVTSQTGVFLRTRDIARLASAAADDVDGVLSATSAAGRRTVTVTVESDRDGIADLVTDAVGQRLSVLASPPKVKVRARAHWKPRESN